MKTSILTVLCFGLATATSGLAQSVPSQPLNPVAPSQIATTPAPAQAMTTQPNTGSTEGFFVGFDAGAFYLQNLTVGSPGFNVNFNYSTGTAFTLPIGYDFGNGFKTFLTVGDYNADYSGLVGNYGGGSQRAATYGGVQFIPIMANVSYKVQLVGGLHFEIGGGIGAVYGNDTFSPLDDPVAKAIWFGQLTPPGTPAPTAYFNGISTTSWSLGFQGFTGLSYDFTENFSLKVGYRYIHVDHNISVNGASSSGMNGQTFEGGLTWKF